MGAELDLTRLTELQRLLGTSLPELIVELVSEITDAIAGIESGFAANDLQAVARAAHAARNSVLMLDAQPMLEALAEIESGARASDADAAGRGVSRLHSTWPALRERLARETRSAN